MKKMRLLDLVVAAVLSFGFVSCDDDGDDNGEPQNPAAESGYTPANPETGEYGIAISQEVDLGLSVNWSGWNVGATSPEGCGGYYAWGETEEKEDYDWSAYKWCNGSENEMTKYCTDSGYGAVDNKTTLEPADDVAHVKWGDGWRMPTADELSELTNTSNCTWEWITYKGVNGYKVTGKKLSNGNRNSIFLPAAGYRNGTSLGSADRHGFCWCSTLESRRSCVAYELGFNRDNRIIGNGYRYLGQSVRPVKEK